MNRCPHCLATANPFRLFWRRPYVCPKCGGRAVHLARWMELRYFIAPFATGLTAALLRDWLAGLLQAEPFLAVCLIVGQLLFWLVLVHWLSGRLIPVLGDAQPSTANQVGPIPKNHDP